MSEAGARFSRRSMLATPLALAGCASSSDYFGKAKTPRFQRLVFQLGAEPDTLDPAMSQAGSEEFILPSLFEGLLTLHPTTNKPVAAIATHYDSDSRQTRFTFYLRGHAQPAGIRLEGGPASSMPARWSDGRIITAHDFVYSWRRAVDPSTAAPWAYLFYCIRNAEEINSGRHPVESLAVEAVDDFTLRVTMRSPTPWFLQLHDSFVFYAVPGHVVERMGSLWTLTEHMVCCGPFQLAEWKSRNTLRLVKNPHYYDAASVQLEEITMLPVVNTDASVNLYKAGESDWVPGKLVPPIVIPSLQRKKDFHTAPAFWCMFYAINIRVAPFNNVLVRYALNMATDKRGIASFMEAGRMPASSLMPPCSEYPAIDTLPVEIEGAVYDVLKYDPAGARELLGKAGVDSVRIEILYPNRPGTADLPQILQQQWRKTLGAEVIPIAREEKIWLQDRSALAYKGVAERGFIGDYLDPNTFLDAFRSGSNVIGSGWSDPQYDIMLSDANGETNTTRRMRKLADCERRLLRAMPILPLYYNVLAYLRKPYVQGFNPRQLGLVRFKYVWVDTHWSSQ
jgi:ABC-type oligopeptide transport system substrate-binding subunit